MLGYHPSSAKLDFWIQCLTAIDQSCFNALRKTWIILDGTDLCKQRGSNLTIGLELRDFGVFDEFRYYNDEEIIKILFRKVTP